MVQNLFLLLRIEILVADICLFLFLSIVGATVLLLPSILLVEDLPEAFRRLLVLISMARILLQQLDTKMYMPMLTLLVLCMLLRRILYLSKIVVLIHPCGFLLFYPIVTNASPVFTLVPFVVCMLTTVPSSGATISFSIFIGK